MILNIVFFLINILILAVIYIFLRLRIDKLANPDNISKKLAGDLDIILSEINQATERNILIIEDKITELEALIETADKRITLLKKKSDDKVMPAVIKDDSAASDKPRAEIEPEQGTQLEFDKNELTYSHLNKLNIMSGMVTPLTVSEKQSEDSDNVKERVIELYRNGFDTSIISANVGINRGEVELIISLYNQMGGKQE